MKFNPRQTLTLIKGSPEKVVSWLLLIIFISLSSYLAASGLRKTSSFSLEEMSVRKERREPLTEAGPLVDFGGLLTKKPVTYYTDIAQRNPFSGLPEVFFLTSEEKKANKIRQIETLLAKLNIVKEYKEYYQKYLFEEYGITLELLDATKMEKEQRNLIELEGDTAKLEEFLIDLRERGREEKSSSDRPDKSRIGLTCCGIVGTLEGRVAFIEGKKAYWVKEGDEVEGWKVLKVEQDKVTLYKEEGKKGLILYLGGRHEGLEDFAPAGGRDAEE